ncbi:hypothetical protein [Ralstonia phage phiRSL1]|uniref:Uncharacterized protein n=1 Tax=Ralstonia phage phiRSL1 TaxID=1980924 RepID=B2ZY43_9CAUD|nr:hypothetical protein RSL1_ORF189 [Ralstonia phage phiRSL1]BAG41638.1 hypothetical protein [Ralstonia phage phiRSL1]
MARPPFPTATDYLQILTDDFYAGLNQKNLREMWTPYTSASLINSFTLPTGGSTINGAWSIDSGDPSLPLSQQEPRAYCVKGKISCSVSGTTLIVRVQLNSGWGSASVYVDGVKPSTISGLASYADTIDCNLDNHAGVVGGNQYYDLVIADGLSSSGPHTIDLYVNNGASGFVVIAGYKSRAYQQVGNNYSGWVADATTGLNRKTLTLKNVSTNPIAAVSLAIPSGVVNPDGSAISSPVNVGTISPGASYSLPYAVNGASIGSLTPVITFGMSAQYADPAGSISLPVAVTLPVGNTGLTFDTHWSMDNSTPTSVERAFSTALNATVSWTMTDTQFTITLQKDSGWGTAKVMVGGTQYGTLSSNDAVGGGFLADTTITGLPAGSKTVSLVATTNGSKPFVFTQVAFNTTLTLTQVSENVNLNYALSYIPPFAPANPSLGANGEITWTASSSSASDYSIPRDNTGITEYRVKTRFPTFAVYYATGMGDLLSNFDVVIIEPTAVSRAQVAAWQAKGILVLGYVSFGEEDGERVDIYDLSDNRLQPHVDDGKGPGGFASYYNKGGNGFREASECQNDNQAANGTKTCALANAHYFKGVGRCGLACQWDSQNGYAAQSTGGACAKGYTSANFWQRDATQACQNASCPQYNPTNTKCPQYQQATVHWGQDFSIATPNLPDQNGIWGSTYTNPLMPRWKQKLQNFYMPYVFGTQTQMTENIAVKSHVGGASGTKTFVARVNGYPFDDQAAFSVTTVNGSYTYLPNSDYGYDAVTGVFSFDLTAGTSGGAPALTDGTQLKFTYYKKGLQCDGLFMDTVDTVDVYPSDQFNQGMADMINGLKQQYPNAHFCSNRGFSVLNKIIKSCRFVMFESFLSDYNFTTGSYQLVTDPDSVAFNNEIIQQLNTLRNQYTFDVIALNYAPNDSSGDSIRDTVNAKAYELGYMSWLSVIDLNAPQLTNVNVNPNGVIRQNQWTIVRKKKYGS